MRAVRQSDFKKQMAPLGTSVSLLLPIPFDAPHKGEAKVGRTPPGGGDQIKR